MNAEKYIKLGQSAAIGSFLLGIFILLMYVFTLASDIEVFGLFFIIGAFILNLIILLLLLYKAVIDTVHRKKLLKTAALMLINIPVALVCLTIQGHFENTVRITFTNSTKTTLTDIHITGCQIKHIDKLAPAESKLITIDVPNDCSVNLDYLQNGKRDSVVVEDYLTNGMGQYMTYNINGINEQF